MFAGSAPARRQVRCSPAAIAAPRKLLLPPALLTLTSIVDAAASSTGCNGAISCRAAPRSRPSLGLRPVTDQDDIEPIRAPNGTLQAHRRRARSRQARILAPPIFPRPAADVLARFRRSVPSRRAQGAASSARPSRCYRAVAGSHTSKRLPCPGLALHANGSIMITNDFANSCETEAGPAKRVVKNGSNIRRATRSSKPRPLSLTAMHT